jgi:hypothetical protein
MWNVKTRVMPIKIGATGTWAVGVTTGSTEVPGRKPVKRDNNDNNNNNNNNNYIKQPCQALCTLGCFDKC